MRDSKQLSDALLSLRRCNARGAGDSRLNPGVTKPPRKATSLPRVVACVLLVLIAAIYGIKALVGGSAKRASIAPAVQLAITNPLAFAKSHVTGGIGAVVLADPVSGLPKIQMLVAGSPAQKAGLRPGDVILEIDGVSAQGRTLAQNIERIRGIASVGVELTIQRAGSTNLNCVLHRASWSGMGIVQ